MLKLALVSDIHNEFYNQGQAPDIAKVDADILVLAGDIEVIKRHDNDWWDRNTEGYDQVIYIHGNHEYYKTYLSDYPSVYYPDNVHAVRTVADIIEYRGVRIMAGTMWTDLRNPIHAETVKRGMNDYRRIKYSRNRHYITPDDTTALYLKFVDMLIQESPDIVISHHLPSFESVDFQYRTMYSLNHGYASNVPIPESVKIWMHGHTHIAKDYMLGDTRVVCNPKGYPGESFEPYFPKVIEYAV